MSEQQQITEADVERMRAQVEDVIKYMLDQGIRHDEVIFIAAQASGSMLNIYAEQAGWSEVEREQVTSTAVETLTASSRWSLGTKN